MRVQAQANEGAGYQIPERDPLHEDPQWFEMDLDDELDAPDLDPLPTLRHRIVPGMSEED